MVTIVTNIPHIYGQSVATGSREDVLDEADGKQHNTTQTGGVKRAETFGEGGKHDERWLLSRGWRKVVVVGYRL